MLNLYYNFWIHEVKLVKNFPNPDIVAFLKVLVECVHCLIWVIKNEKKIRDVQQ